MNENPYAAPRSDLTIDPDRPAGTTLPFEDPGAGPRFGQRVSETLRWLFFDWNKAGQGLGGSQALGAPFGFLVLLGMIPSVLVGMLGVIHPVRPIWQVWMGTPPPPAPSGAFAIAMLLGVVAGGPIGTGIGVLLAGLINHVGLWMVRGTREGLGLLVTLRSAIYTSAAIMLILLPFQLLGHIPGVVGSYLLLLPVLLQVVGVFYQGAILARAHRTDTWRGILGIWLPILILGGLAAICLGTLWLLAGEVFQRAFLQGLRGGR